MASKGLYVPGKDGTMEFRGIAEQEERPILSFEEDTGRILLNFNAILVPKGRKLQDIITVTEGGQVMGLILTSTAMGPEERAARDRRIAELNETIKKEQEKSK
jgi:hypothetical protein